VLLAVGISCAGPVFSPFIADKLHIGFSLSIQGLARTASSLLVLDFLHLDFLVFLRSSSCLSSPLSAFDFLHLASLLLVRNMDRPGPTFSMFGCGCAEPIILICDLAKLGFSPFPRTLSHPEPFLPILSMAHLNSSVLLHALACPDLLLLFAGFNRVSSIFSLSLVDFVCLDSPVPVQSPSHLDLMLLILDETHVGSSLSVHSFARMESSFSTAGISRLGFVFALLVSNEIHTGSLLLIRSSAKPEFVVPLTEVAAIGSFAFARSYCRPSSSLLALGVGRLGFPASLFGAASVEFTPLLQSSSQSGSAPLILSLVKPDSSTFARASAQLALMLPVCGLSWAGSIFSLSVIDDTHIGSLLPLQSFARLGFNLFVLDSSFLGFVLPVRSYTQVAFPLLLFGLARLGFVFSLFLVDAAHFDFLPLVHSFLCLSLVLLVLDTANMDSSVSLRSSSHLEVSSPALSSTGVDSLMLVRQLACSESGFLVLGMS